MDWKCKMVMIAGQRLNIGHYYGKNIVILVSSVVCNIVGKKTLLRLKFSCIAQLFCWI